MFDGLDLALDEPRPAQTTGAVGTTIGHGKACLQPGLKDRLIFFRPKAVPAWQDGYAFFHGSLGGCQRLRCIPFHPHPFNAGNGLIKQGITTALAVIQVGNKFG